MAPSPSVMPHNRYPLSLPSLNSFFFNTAQVLMLLSLQIISRYKCRKSAKFVMCISTDHIQKGLIKSALRCLATVMFIRCWLYQSMIYWLSDQWNFNGISAGKAVLVQQNHSGTSVCSKKCFARQMKQFYYVLSSHPPGLISFI